MELHAGAINDDLIMTEKQGHAPSRGMAHHESAEITVHDTSMLVAGVCFYEVATILYQLFPKMRSSKHAITDHLARIRFF